MGFFPSYGEARRPPSFAKIAGELRRDLAEASAEAGSASGAKAAALIVVICRYWISKDSVLDIF